MLRNMSQADRIIRTLISLGIFILILTNLISGILAVVLGIAAVILILTSIFGTCPIYMLFGLSTRKKLNNVTDR